MPRAVDIVAQVAPRAFGNYVRAFDSGDAAFAQFAITTPLRLAHFLAQAFYETGGGTVLFENLDYTTADRLLQIFGVGNHSAAVRPDEVAGLLNNRRRSPSASTASAIRRRRASSATCGPATASGIAAAGCCRRPAATITSASATRSASTSTAIRI